MLVSMSHFQREGFFPPFFLQWRWCPSHRSVRSLQDASGQFFLSTFSGIHQTGPFSFLFFSFIDLVLFIQNLFFFEGTPPSSFSMRFLSSIRSWWVPLFLPLFSQGGEFSLSFSPWLKVVSLFFVTRDLSLHTGSFLGFTDRQRQPSEKAFPSLLARFLFYPVLFLWWFAFLFSNVSII